MRTDIRLLKSQKRDEIKNWRRALSKDEKKKLDELISDRFFESYVYTKTKQVFVYVSTDIEVDTMRIIERALKDGHRVACPRCVEGTREMEFFYISGTDDLYSGSFGVLEPLREEKNLVKDFSHGVCVVPGLAFDNMGFRLGYGKGYYDRFLSDYSGFTCGLCYSDNTVRSLPHGRFDRHVGLLITDKFSRRCR